MSDATPITDEEIAELRELESAWTTTESREAREIFEFTLRNSFGSLLARIEQLERAVQLAQSDIEVRVWHICAELGGLVEGRPTASINYLQRIRELRFIEQKYAALGAAGKGAD